MSLLSKMAQQRAPSCSVPSLPGRSAGQLGSDFRTPVTLGIAVT